MCVLFTAHFYIVHCESSNRLPSILDAVFQHCKNPPLRPTFQPPGLIKQPKVKKEGLNISTGLTQDGQHDLGLALGLQVRKMCPAVSPGELSGDGQDEFEVNTTQTLRDTG